MDKLLWQFKVESAKRKAKATIEKGIELAKKGAEWAKENKEVVAPVIIVSSGLAKKAIKEHKANKEERDRLMRFYDPHTFRHTKAKRVPTAREEAEIDRRYKSGESYRSILRDMGLL